MNVPVDTVTTFNTAGDIKINFIRIEDENHELHTYKVENIEFIKDESHSGFKSLLFGCNIILDGCMKCVKIRYLIESHKWMLLG